jgi:hypothetical protein
MPINEFVREHLDAGLVLAALLAAGVPVYVGVEHRVTQLESASTHISERLKNTERAQGRWVQSGNIELPNLNGSVTWAFKRDNDTSEGDRDSAGWWVARREVRIDPSRCADKPNVVVSLSGFDMGSKSGFPTRLHPNNNYPGSISIEEKDLGNARILIAAEDVASDRFVVAVRVWADTKLHWVKVTWIADCSPR